MRMVRGLEGEGFLQLNIQIIEATGLVFLLNFAYLIILK
jgi:hypothetical protein